MENKYLKVLFINHTARMAGAERILLELLKEFKKYNVKSRVILPFKESFDRELDKIHIPYKIISYTWWAGRENHTESELDRLLLNNVRSTMEIVDEIQLFKPDIVYTNTLVIPWGAIASTLTNTKHVWAIHEFGEADQDLRLFFGDKTSFEIVNRLSSAIITNSKAVQNHVAEYVDIKKLYQYYYYIPTPHSELMKKPINYFRNKTSLKLLVLGSIISFKGQLDAVRAMQKLKKEDIELVLIGPVGDLTYKEEIDDYIIKNNLGEKVRIYNYTDYPFAAIQQADVVLLSSRQEAIARVVFESMLLKKPVIGTNSGGTPEQVKSNFNGLLYQPGNIEELVKCILFFKKNPKKIIEFGKNGYSFSKKRFTKKNYYAKILRTMLKVINEKVLTHPDFLLNLLKTQYEYKTALEKEGSELKSHINNLEKYSDELELSLNKIQSSRTYRVWQLYCKLRDTIIKQNRL